jgi:hypothetical protein
LLDKAVEHTRHDCVELHLRPANFWDLRK